MHTISLSQDAFADRVFTNNGQTMFLELPTGSEQFKGSSFVRFLLRDQE